MYRRIGSDQPADGRSFPGGVPRVTGYQLPISEVRRIVERVCARQDVLDACAERDLGYVITVFEENGLTQSQMASLTGLHQVQLSNYKTGKHRPKEISVFTAFADGLGLPPAARQALGLDTSPPTAAAIGVPQPRPAPFAEVSLDYPGTAGQATGNVTSLWRARPRPGKRDRPAWITVTGGDCHTSSG